MQKITATLTNILLTVIALALITIIILILNKDVQTSSIKEIQISAQLTDSPDTAQETQVSDSLPVKLVTPPAPGIFSESSVKDFHSVYNPQTRTFTITAQVAKKFFFEANSPVALYDHEGNLIEMKGAMTTVDMYSTQNQYLPLTFTFKLPLTESPDQQFIVRIMQDDPSGGEAGTPLYWGKVIGTR